ncbi:MAG: nucleoside monophosphate kinase, partial [Ruminococcus sp.]|nr:nucleoside monophosphate kinase [Ruminococcus sp.]
VIDKVIDIEVPDERIIARMSGLRVCSSCGASYHLQYKLPKEDGVCDLCSGTLVQRKDDHPDTVKARLDVYHSETEPLKEFYSKQGKLAIVEGQEEISETTALVYKELDE